VVGAMEEGGERRSGSSSELVYFSVYFGFVLRLGSISDLYILVLLKRQLVWVLYLNSIFEYKYWRKRAGERVR